MIVIVLVLVFVIFALLLLRFVQPQFLYWVREVLLGVRTNKAFLDLDAGREVTDYPALLVNDLRPEGVSLDIDEILSRVTKIRELYSVMDLARPEIAGLRQARNSPVCVLELSNMMGVFARHLIPDARFKYAPIKAMGLLHHVAERRGAKNLPKEDSEKDVEAYFKEFPVSIEELNELLIAGIYAASYRVQRQESTKTEATSVP